MLPSGSMDCCICPRGTTTYIAWSGVAAHSMVRAVTGVLLVVCKVIPVQANARWAKKLPANKQAKMITRFIVKLVLG